MNELFKKLSTANTGYFWPLTFLDSQEEFSDTLGIQAMMYHTFEKYDEAHNALRELEQFVDACQLDVFIFVCRMEYVGTDTDDTTFYVQEVCNEIS